MDGEPHNRRQPGGNVGRDEIEIAAKIALAGLDPLAFLRNHDPLEAQIMDAVAARTLELLAETREDQAVRIASAVGKMLW